MKKVILITGISSGFGKQTAKFLADEGHTVFGTVRKDAETEDRVHHILMDLTDPDTIKKAVSEVFEKEGRIDVLINNAGMHSGGPSKRCPSKPSNSKWIPISSEWCIWCAKYCQSCESKAEERLSISVPLAD